MKHVTIAVQAPASEIAEEVRGLTAAVESASSMRGLAAVLPESINEFVAGTCGIGEKSAVSR